MSRAEMTLPQIEASIERENRAWKEAMDKGRRISAIAQMMRAYDLADIHQRNLINLSRRQRFLEGEQL